MKKLLITILFSVFVIPISTFASNELKLSIVGSTKPNSFTTIRLTSPYADLGGTTIAWYHNGEFQEEGAGMLTHKVFLGDIGEVVKVTAVLAIENSGGIYNQSIILSPAILDTIWEAQTAVPPFYHGKSLPSHESLIKTMAIANFGTSTNSTGINYSWTKNKSTGIGDGLNVISSSLFGAWENSSVPVNVVATLNGIAVNSSMDIPSFIPTVLFYEVSPTQGILTQELLNTNPERNSVELSLKAIPFGFSLKEKIKHKILYEWKAGNKIIKSGQGESMEDIELTRSDSDKKSGSISITLSAQNTVNVMQSTTDKFIWNFNEK